MIRLVQLRCVVCSSLFSVQPYQVRRGARFCGIRCRAEGSKGRFAGEKNPRWLGPQSCKHCGKPVKTRRGGKRQFCSRECFHIGGMSDWIRTDANGVRYAGRIDANQPEIVEALEKAGFGVLIASNLGKGFPDLIVGIPGNNVLLEVKNPEGDYGKRGLNKLQKAFHATWPGPICVAYTVEEALEKVRAFALEAAAKREGK